MSNGCTYRPSPGWNGQCPYAPDSGDVLACDDCPLGAVSRSCHATRWTEEMVAAWQAEQEAKKAKEG